MGEGVGVLRDAGQQDRGQLAGRCATPSSGSRSVDHLAGGGGGRVDPDGRSEAGVADVVVDVGHVRALASQSAWSVATLPVRARSPASTTTATSGSSPGAFAHLVDARQEGEAVEAAGRRSRPRTALPRRSAAIAMAMAAPSVSASGFSWQIAVTRCAQRSSATTSFMSRPWWLTRPRCRAGCAAPDRRRRWSRRAGSMSSRDVAQAQPLAELASQPRRGDARAPRWMRSAPHRSRSTLTQTRA